MPSRGRLTVAQKKARAEKAAATRARNKAIRAQQNSDGDQPPGGEERDINDDGMDIDDHNNGHSSGNLVLEACYNFLADLDPKLRDANKLWWDTYEMRRELALDRDSSHTQHSKELWDRCEAWLDGSSQHVKLLEDQRSKVREMANGISKQHLRPLRILDMPDEILMEIFEHLAHDDWLDLESRVVMLNEESRARDIRNIRLTCRRFHNTGSHFLRRIVQLDCFNPSSLSRLEEIARHPMFSKGVETVRIHLGFYVPLLATEILVFADYIHQKLSIQIDHAENIISPNDKDGTPYHQQLENLEAARRIAASWQQFADGDRRLHPEDVGYEDDMSYRKLLERGHREYQLRFAIQERLKRDGNLVRAVAAAMSKMPRAKRLQFREENRLPAGRNFYMEADDNAMFEQLVKFIQSPMSWRDAEKQQLGMPPTEMLVQLPGAIHKAGASLTEINILLENPSNLSTLAHSQNELLELRAAVQSLRKFKLHLGSEYGEGILANWWSIEQPGESEGLRKFLQAILDSPRMERLNLTLKRLWDVGDRDVEDPTPPSFSLGSFMNLQPWQELKQTTWHGLPIHLAEMSRFLDQHAGKGMKTSMCETYLLSGTWAETLDLLREKAPHASLEVPLGGELETLSEKQILDIFGSYEDRRSGSPNRKDMYLSGQISDNPLRDPPADEVNEGEQSDEEADGEGPGDEEMIDAP